MNPASLHALHVLLNSAGFTAWTGACGLMLARAGIMPRAAFALPAVARQWARAVFACLAVLAAAGCALLVIRTMEMGGLALAQVLALLPAVLLQTHFGRVWGLHLSLIAAIAAGIAVCLRVSVSPPVVRFPFVRFLGAGAMLVLAFTYSATSHAGDRGDFTLIELNDWVHVIACSAWAGAIAATLLFAYPLLRGRRELLAQTIFRLSALAAAALPPVLLTGACNAVLRIPSLADLAATAYGRTLAVKVALVAIMVVLGTYSRFVLIPAIKRATHHGDADRHIGRVGVALGIDAVLLVAVLAAASMLIQGMPPSSAGAMAHGMQQAHRAIAAGGPSVG